MRKIGEETGNVGDFEVVKTKPLSFDARFEKFSTAWVYGKWFYPAIAGMIILLAIKILQECGIDSIGYIMRFIAGL